MVISGDAMKKGKMRPKAYTIPVREDQEIRIEDFRRTYSTIDRYLIGLNHIRVIEYLSIKDGKVLRPIKFEILDTTKEKNIDHTLRKYGAVQLRRSKSSEQY